MSKTDEAKIKTQDGLSRRRFLKNAGIFGGIGLGSLAFPNAWGAGPVALAAQDGQDDAGFTLPQSPIPDSLITQTVSADVVVLGAGVAGLAAGASAAEAGAKTVVLEKFDRSAAPGMVNGAVNAKDQKGKGIHQDIDDLVKKLVWFSEGRAQADLVKKWAQNSGPVMDWLLDMAITEGIDVMKPLGPFGYLFGSGMMSETVIYDMMTSYGVSYGMDVRYNCAAVQLVRPNEKGRVKGVIVKTADGGFSRFDAQKAVVICTGDYGSNPEMMAKYASWTGTGMENFYRIKTNTGDGHQIAAQIGGLIEKEPHCPIIHFNSTNARPRLFGRPVGGVGEGAKHYLYVNHLGDRFVNEALPNEYLATIVLRQPFETFWQVFDAKSVDEKNKKIVQKGLGTREILSAGTLVDLAKKFGAAPQKFKTAVDRYNHMVKIGEDKDFYKAPRYLGAAIDKPPFYVCESPPNFLVCMGGLTIDKELRVLDTAFNAIPGLYAAGNIAGGIWGDSYPHSILPGIARGIALTFGRLAGLGAAQKK